jgi:phosphatidate phosphatase PAH1
MRRALPILLLVGLGSTAAVADPVPEVRCAGEPAVKAVKFRHIKNRVIAAFGDPMHRGVDLIAAADEKRQTITGAVAYTDVDKALEDEDVDLYACDAGSWRWLGMARTDDEGRFELTLEGRERLAVGLRDLYASVSGNRSGSRFVAYVAPAGSKIVVADVDGTLTSSENAFPMALFFGGSVRPNVGAPALLRGLAASGYQVVYVTARGDRFSETTRSWIDAHGFPRGPMRLARSLVTMPGNSTIAYKTDVLRRLSRRFDIAAAFGNRHSDVVAYTTVGVAPAKIFVKASEFANELVAALKSNAATGFASYETLKLP